MIKTLFVVYRGFGGEYAECVRRTEQGNTRPRYHPLPRTWTIIGVAHLPWTGIEQVPPRIAFGRGR